MCKFISVFSNWKQPRFPSVGERENKLWSTVIVKHYSAIKCINYWYRHQHRRMSKTMLSERNQTEKYYRIPLLRHSEKGENYRGRNQITDCRWHRGRGTEKFWAARWVLTLDRGGSMRERTVVLPTSSAISLSAVSVTCRSEHIKWKIPEINNLHVLNHGLFWRVMTSHALQLCRAQDMNHPLVHCVLPIISHWVVGSVIRRIVVVLQGLCSGNPYT